MGTGSNGVAGASPRQDGVTVEEYQRWLQRRDARLGRIPQVAPATSEEHADIALLEEWLEGNVSDERVERYMSRFENCKRCEQVYDNYKALKGDARR